MVIYGLVTAFSHSCRLLWSDSFSHICCISYHAWGMASVGAFYYNIYSLLLLSPVLYCVFAAYYDLIFVYLSLLNSFTSLILANTAFCTLYASSLWSHIKTWFLLTSLVSFKADSPFIILAMMVSSFMPFMDCSFRLLSYYWYLQSVALMQSAIHFSADSSFSLFSSEYSKYSVVSLCCGLKFSPGVVFRPSAVLYASFSEFENLCIKCNPSLPDQFFTIETSSPSLN